MPVDTPRGQQVAMQEIAVRLLEMRKSGGPLKSVARELLVGAHDALTRVGLDRVLDDLAAAHGNIDVDDRFSLAEHAGLVAALVAQLETIDLDGGGPRNAKPRQLTECLTTALDLRFVDEPDRAIALDDSVRVAMVAAMTAVVERELAVPASRTAIITEARARCDAAVHASFDRVAEHLDERGQRLLRQPKIPIDQMQAIQRALSETRNALVARTATLALARAEEVLGRADPEVVARLDRPVTARATPRALAILRAQESRVGGVPAQVVTSLATSLTELVPIAWRAPVLPVHPYGASKTFTVGQLVEHPKFGRGLVTATFTNRVEIEFPDGKRALAHVGPRG